jgi:hypothetical protein
MKDRVFRNLKAGTARAALAMFGLLGLAFATVVSLGAQEAPATNPQLGKVVTAYLEYQDATYSYENWGMQLAPKSPVFKKEPAYSRGKVTRGMWQLGGGVVNDVAFAWDHTARKLYVDLNGNLDLTDDPAGVFSSDRGAQDNFQWFPNVRLPIKVETTSRQMLVDLSFSDYGVQVNCTAAAHSFWQGKATLQGEEWQVGMLGMLTDQRPSLQAGNLLLRPWAERNKPFSVNSGSLAALPISRKVFFGNRAYQLQITNEEQGDGVKVGLQFTEQTPRLGEMKVAGTFVQRATLERGPYLVVVDQPLATVKVPVGRYSGAKVCLKRGDVEAYLDGRTQVAMGQITVNEKTPAVLMAGGPLTNSASVSRQGRNLSLNYQLVGVGGVYKLASQDRSHPPEFTVYQGDKKVASGKFEFG